MTSHIHSHFAELLHCRILLLVYWWLIKLGLLWQEVLSFQISSLRVKMMYLSRELWGNWLSKRMQMWHFWLNNLQWSGQMLTFCESDPTSKTVGKPRLYPALVSGGTFTRKKVKLHPVEHTFVQIQNRAQSRSRRREAFHHTRELLLDDCRLVKQCMLDIFQSTALFF